MQAQRANLLPYETVDICDEDSALVIIDQTLLPGEEKILRLKTQPQIWEAIYSLRVRGAPAIGVAAAMGLYLHAKAIETQDYDGFMAQLKEGAQYLASSRPTAVNLFWALERMQSVAQKNGNLPIEGIKAALLKEARAIYEEDVQVCYAIGENGLTLLKPNMGILTHCNAGQLAATRWGTALAPIYAGHEKGYNFKVFTDETRPLLQGARLSAYELSRAGVDVTLLCDNMAASAMARGWIDAVFVGCDRVAMNGDIANKIGTSAVSILAKHYGIPFYVCAPISTIDRRCASGSAITIEQRAPEEVTDMWYQKPMAPQGVKVYNPAFDVTEHSLITAIITEKGIVRPPLGEGLEKLF